MVGVAASSAAFGTALAAVSGHGAVAAADRRLLTVFGFGGSMVNCPPWRRSVP